MNDIKKLVPLLRFPAFQQNEEWENVKLGDCLLQTPDYGLNAPAVPYSESLPTYLRITDITDSGKFDKSHLASVNTELTSENSLQEGDLVVARTGASVGKVYKYRKEDGPLVFAGFLIRLRPNPNKCNSEYLFQYMLSPSYKRWVNITSTRSGQPGINSAEYASLTVPFPQKLSEQQRIAECLFSIDSYISSINEKVEQLKSHKTSLMQKLFPQKGQTTPKYRFPDFRDSIGWEEIRLGDIFDRVTNKNNTDNQNVLTISAQYGLVSQYDYFHKSVAASNLSNYYLIKKGDFTYNKSRSQGYPYGAIKPLRLYEEGVVSTLYICFRIKEGDFRDTFFEQYFETELINEEIGKIAQEGARNHGLLNISTDDFFNKVILFVPSLSEQEKIAECLSSIDRSIRLYSEKASQLEHHKKGLMQQLFPQL